MTNRSARKLRQTLDLPRLPKMMSEPQRLAYRQLKRRFTRMSAPVKARFLENVTALRATVLSA